MLQKFWQRSIYIKAKKLDFHTSSTTMEKFTLCYCCSPYLLSLVIPKVMVDSVVNLIVANLVFAAYAVTVITLAVRQIMLALSRNTSYQNKFKSVIGANDKEGLRALSQHPIQNACYEAICLGGNTRGIHGMTPGEPFYAPELGLFNMMTEGFYLNLR
jgi:hypothetical protein